VDKVVVVDGFHHEQGEVNAADEIALEVHMLRLTAESA
jgi:hypothetical protein